MKFGDLIKEIRLSNNLTQYEVAQKVEISRSVLSQYEHNLVEPTANVVKKFAQFFDVSADYLLGLENDYGAKLAAPMSDVGYSSEERKLIEIYRSLPDKLKKVAYDQLEILSGADETLPKHTKKV